MGRLLLLAFVAHFRAGKVLFLLTLAGVALGVASVVGIQILNRSALGAFEGSLQAVSGEADLSVLPRADVLDETLLPRVLATPGVAAAWPLWRVEVALAGEPEPRFLQVVGVDLFAAARIPWDGEAPPGDLGEALVKPGWVAVTPELAAEKGWKPGSTFEVSLGTRRVRLHVGALVDFRKLTPLASRRLVVMDLAQAQDRFGARGELGQIDVKASPGERDAAARGLRARLGPGVEVVSPEQRRSQATGLLGAFRLNLTALSLISLFVGGFLIHASTRAALVRRRSEFGLLRSLGASPALVLRLILAEVAVLGTLGTVIGVPLGWAAAQSNVETVSRTISNLYMLEEIERLDFPWWMVPLAAAVGAGGVLAGALGPALETARRDPRRLLAAFDLHESLGGASKGLFVAGLAVLAGAGVFGAVVRDAWRPGGFVLAVAIVVAIPLVVPWLLSRSAARLRAGGFSFLYGARALGARLGSTAFAVAALAVAVAMLVGITLMIGSFRRTVELWIGKTLAADVYVTTASWERSRRAAVLDPALERGLASMPGVVAVDRLRQVVVRSGERRITVGGAELGRAPDLARVELLSGDPVVAMRRVIDHGAALISEPFARKAGLAVGDRFPVTGPDGDVSLEVAGIFYDYSSESGGALVDLATLDGIFGPRPVSNIALYLAPGVDPESIVDRIRAEFPDAGLQARSNRTLREEVYRIFDQTFAVTRLLQAMSLLIAACGITLTLLILARERVSELALYRALGATRAQIFRVFLGKGLGMGVLGLAVGSVAGVLLALVLVLVINRAWFGWTIAMHWPWGALAAQTGTILLAAIAASVYPAVRASGTPATELSRDDL
ncbi:MAG TPA: FtsX-like permease family protein [Candidatus Polarisedimenticolaceae bacterium]